MKKLKLLIIHCTATPEGRIIYPSDIIEWHTSAPPKGRGWKQVGYSDMIMLDGALMNLVSYNEDDIVDPWEVTNGAKGINSIARHVVYVGGCDKKRKPKDTRTLAQRETLSLYVKRFLASHTGAKVGGHNQFAKKACPSFDVPKWLRSIGINEHNIYTP